MDNYFSKDICNMIKYKLSLDYQKYRFWCFTECQWVYIWTTCDLLTFTKCYVKCPNHDNHLVNLDIIRIVSRIKSNGNILLFNTTKKIDDRIKYTDFKIINI